MSVELLRKLLLAGLGWNYSSAVCFAADDAEASGEEVEVIDLEDNLDEAEKPPELRAGKYIGEVQGVEVKTSGNSGNRYYAVKFHIAPDELPADLRDQYEDGADMWWNRQLVPDKGDRRTLWNLKRFIGNLGLSTNVTRIDPNEWMGCRCRLVVGPGKPYNGETRAEIKSIEPAEDDAPQRDAGKAAQAAAATAKGKGKEKANARARR